MQRKSKAILGSATAAAGCLALVGCGGGETSAPVQPTTVVPTQYLDTATVLSIVQMNTSETATPFMVNGGVVAVIPSDDETGSPIFVNGA